MPRGSNTMRDHTREPKDKTHSRSRSRLGVRLDVSVAFVDVLDRRRRRGSCQHSRVSGLSGGGTGGENTNAEWHLDAH